MHTTQPTNTPYVYPDIHSAPNNAGQPTPDTDSTEAAPAAQISLTVIAPERQITTSLSR